MAWKLVKPTKADREWEAKNVKDSTYDVCNDPQYWYDLRDYGPEEAQRRRSLRWQIRRTDE